jgi:hypothetical protein
MPPEIFKKVNVTYGLQTASSMLHENSKLTNSTWDLPVYSCFLSSASSPIHLNLQVVPCYLVDPRYLRSSSWTMLPIWPMHATWGDLLFDPSYLIDPCYLRSASWPMLPEQWNLTKATWYLLLDPCYLRSASWPMQSDIYKMTHATWEVEPCYLRSESRLLIPKKLIHAT